ncbi:lysM and putative peptidoglycan-binding domain-containing protein 1 [Nematolebias whitei]|uniref:lysM and putative peptidoglycan-binding domain-containing protein 1 n=1 Tax=Nematolebias whitei TaxID=451745 RepID=UPI00189A2134|nr:lysM and putative peptidoglycan-binding domain-containing protein 1 [Nematolebias whitei]
MSGERLTSGRGGGLSRGSRTRSYGSLIRSSLTPVRHGFIEHTVQPGDTLQGLAVRYGVSMELIKRANRLYTNDSIFLKKSLSIPVPTDLDDFGEKASEEDGEQSNTDSASVQSGHSENFTEKKQREMTPDPTPLDFLRKLDDLISQSKQAAARGCLDAEQRAAALEAACSSRTSGWRPLTRSQSVISSSRIQQQAGHTALPLTITKLTKLKDREDEIFEL